MMRTIVITAPEFSEREAEQIGMLLAEGIDRVHLRKPQSTCEEMQRLLDALPADSLPRITLQDHLQLAPIYGTGGVHLNRRNPAVPQGFSGLKSRSSHTLHEIAEYASDFDYQLLSPLFDSISKAGYSARFTAEELHDARRSGILSHRVVALGGITPENMPAAAEYGFGGVAFLGYLWQGVSDEERLRRVRKIVRLKNKL